MNRGRRDGFDARGFSVLELALAASLLLVVLALVVRQIAPADAALDVRTETADMQQRLRAAVDSLRRDITEAGAAASLAADATPLTTWGAAVWPLRIGLRSPDPPGTFRPDVITVLAALPLPAVATTIDQPLAAQSGAVRVTQGPGCPPLSAVCGLAVDMDVLVADGEGAVDLFTVTDVTPPSVWLRHNTVDWGKLYQPGSVITPVTSRTFLLRPAGLGRPPQLVRYDGAAGPDAAVVDHVVAFAVEYFGEPEPPRMRRPLSDPIGPWTSYGPRPPVDETTPLPVIAGSNCLFASDGSPLALPVLPVLGAAAGPLVPLSSSQLTDGPWCPDAVAPNRYDADLLRIRSVALTIRIESALDALRGPAGVLFSRPGTARRADQYAPDIEMRVRITPPNLAVSR